MISKVGCARAPEAFGTCVRINGTPTQVEADKRAAKGWQTHQLSRSIQCDLNQEICISYFQNYKYNNN